jgi:hypothetical protein
MATETQGEVIRSGSKRVPGLRIKLQAGASMPHRGHHIRCGQHSTPTFLAALRKSASNVASGILFRIANSK